MLEAVLNGAVNFPDPSVMFVCVCACMYMYVGGCVRACIHVCKELLVIQVQKICFGIIKKLVDCWGMYVSYFC